jgi:glycosyltransferase involved in cell wall biosynthesis
MAGFPWGGSEVVWSRAARAAAAENETVLAVVYDWSRTQRAIVELKSAGVSVVTRSRESRRSLVERAVGRVSGGVLPRSIPPWLAELRRFRPEVVCISSGIHYECVQEPELFEWLIGEGIPYVVISNGNSERITYDDSTRARARRFLCAARSLIFVSEGNRELAERQLAFAFDNAVVVPNSVDAVPPAPLPFPDGDPVFVVVGSLYVAFKGQDVLLRALTGSAWRERMWRYVCYGEGPDAVYLRDLAALYGLEGRFTLAGHVEPVSEIWTRSHLCVVPSRAEGMPLALVEALAAGRPAVVTDVGGNAECVEDGVTGFVAEAATPRSLGRALERAWHARARWPEMGKAAWERMARRHGHPGAALLHYVREAARSSR